MSKAKCFNPTDISFKPAQDEHARNQKSWGRVEEQ